MPYQEEGLLLVGERVHPRRERASHPKLVTQERGHGGGAAAHLAEHVDVGQAPQRRRRQAPQHAERTEDTEHREQQARQKAWWWLAVEDAAAGGACKGDTGEESEDEDE